MKMRILAYFLAAVLLIGMLAGCVPGENAVETIPIVVDSTEAPTEAPAEQIDLEALYNQGVEVLAQMGPNAPVLFPETSVDYLDEFYVGLADIELKQLYAGVAPVTNAPFEIILVEVADEADVSAVIEIFQARVDRECDDSTYPENAEAWINNCKITSRGCYVFLAVLMDPCEIPAEFILD